MAEAQMAPKVGIGMAVGIGEQGRDQHGGRRITENARGEIRAECCSIEAGENVFGRAPATAMHLLAALTLQGASRSAKPRY